jgi:putative membrane protein
MPPETQAIFEEWSPPIFLTAVLLLSAFVYVRGWLEIRRTRPALFPVWRLCCFLLGLATIWIAVGSPLDGFADALLSAHMIEHLLLMSFAPPLLLAGYPQVPLLRGLPRGLRVSIFNPLLRARWLRGLGHLIVQPATAWLLMNMIYLLWHVPAAYDFALENEHWHEFEHICFLASSLVFWWPILRPWPTSVRYSGWMMLPYLVGADLVNTALSAFLAFCGHPVYRYYVENPNPLHIDATTDQVTGGVLMWVMGSIVFLVPATAVAMRMASGPRRSYSVSRPH